MRYVSRVIDDELDHLLPSLSAIALDGPKGIGKTETATRRTRTHLPLDQPEIAAIVRSDPTTITARPMPLLVDEWQQVPAVWDVVRRAVDAGAAPGSYLLTGSATPSLDTPVHSGAGRIASLRMRPMSLTERPGMPTPTVHVTALLTGQAPIRGRSPLRLSDYVTEIVASGFPALRPLAPRPRRVQLDGYITRALERGVNDGGGVAHHPGTLRNWAMAYAAATASTASFEAIRAAATPGEVDPPAKSTTVRYRDWLSSLWLLDPVPAWRPAGAPLRRLTASPKHHLADPALAVRLLDLDADDLLDGMGQTLTGHGELLGALFESLATLTVRVLGQAAEARVSHLRTDRGEREVDLILEGRGGRLVGIEVKLASTVHSHDVRNLLWLRDELGTRVKDLVVLTTGPEAYRRPDGVAVVPLALLGL